MNALKSPHRARGRNMWDALHNLSRELYAHKNTPESPHRAGDVTIRVIDVSEVDPNCGWIAEATWAHPGG